MLHYFAHLFNFNSILAHCWALHYYLNHFNMSETAQLIQIIKDVLQPNDQNLRKQSENLLTTLRNDKPNELIYAYLNILKGNPTLIQENTHSNAEISQPHSSDSASRTLPPPPTPISGKNCSQKSKIQSKLACSKSSTLSLTSTWRNTLLTALEKSLVVSSALMMEPGPSSKWISGTYLKTPTSILSLQAFTFCKASLPLLPTISKITIMTSTLCSN